MVAFLSQLPKASKAVVFISTCDGVDYFHRLFTTARPIRRSKDGGGGDGGSFFGPGRKVLRMHGKVEPAERNRATRDFAESAGGCILLATDVAARGLNLPGADWIVQYDPPSSESDYVHRSGRVSSFKYISPPPPFRRRARPDYPNFSNAPPRRPPAPATPAMPSSS